VLTGSAASLKRGLLLTAGSGSFTETGSSASLTKVGSTSYTLTVTVGAFSLSGSAASLKVARLLNAQARPYALSGFAAALGRNKTFQAEAGVFVLLGRGAAFLQPALGLEALDRRLARQHRGKPLADWRRFRGYR
jgi:hypothetical protein